MSLLIWLFFFLRPPLWCFLHLFSKFRERKGHEAQFVDEMNECSQFDYVIHVSSEGEIELVHPILMTAVEKNKQVLLLFTSLSAERKVRILRKQYPKNISISLLNLLYRPFQNPLRVLRKTDKFIMVRYDFFPELLSYGKFASKERILVAGTLIGKNTDNYFKRLYWRYIFNHFDKIFTSTTRDKDRIISLVKKAILVEHFEFRIPRIINRIKNSGHLFNNHWFKNIEKLFDKFPKERRIILGSCWEIDLDIMNNPAFLKEINEQKWLIFLAPHILHERNISLLEQKISLMNISSTILSQEDNVLDCPLIISTIPGILCEMYQFFSYAYVGGGFGRSVHSVLEPFFSAENIYYGPKIGRSTEVELAKEIDRRTIFKLDKPTDFFVKIKKTNQVDMKIRKTFGDQSLLLEEKKISKLIY